MSPSPNRQSKSRINQRLNNLRTNLTYMYCLKNKECIQVSYKKLQPFFKDFSRATLDFQGPPTRNIIISQIVHKCTFLVYSNKALRLELSLLHQLLLIFQFICLELIVNYGIKCSDWRKGGGVDRVLDLQIGRPELMSHSDR